ncbi:hypothetical protein TNIN_239511 [Trichonephila inaurata madagascariensis]|uniref:Uncharacterized protein n=1 Tax=Trichonephila inaurata madagascariensis TaxID=2747483 RepID=A0A8X6MBF4_9ARAC|nr:hypothetical protein TNIN_239511 [Trichonephila inaurata madagascariensis]
MSRTNVHKWYRYFRAVRTKAHNGRRNKYPPIVTEEMAKTIEKMIRDDHPKIAQDQYEVCRIASSRKFREHFQLESKQILDCVVIGGSLHPHFVDAD